MSVRMEEWCRIEGASISNLKEQYGDFKNMPATTVVYYGHPEIQIYNKTSPVNGIVYKVVPIKEFGYNNITEIDKGYTALKQDIEAYNKQIDLDSVSNAAQYYYEPFTVEQSSILFYADSTRTTFNKYIILYVDEYATPKIVSISSQYTGNPVPIGDEIDLNDVKITGIYEDGQSLIIHTGFNIEPVDLKIKNLNSNAFTVSFIDKGKTFTSQFFVQGIKKLIGIEATYSGPNLTQGDNVLRKYLSVVAKYSDNTSGTVTDYSFPDGNALNASGNLRIYYKGFYTSVDITMYNISSSRLMAYYNGGNVEVGNNFDQSKCIIKIYYKSSDGINSKYEDIDPSLCEFSPTTIEHEGNNYINVTYTGKAGKVSTQLIILGIKPEVVLNFIEAEYTGQPIEIGKAYSTERVIVKAHYSDGSIINITNGFIVNTTIVSLLGINTFNISYTDKVSKVKKTTTINVIGVDRETTTSNTYNAITLDNNYPEATRLNNRYRGPAEGYKHDRFNFMLHQNIKELYHIFSSIEHAYNELILNVEDDNAIKYESLNTVFRIQNTVNKYLSDTSFKTGKYVKEEENE